MTKQYPVHHRLVGYDPISETPIDFLELPHSKTDLLRTIIHFDEDDPEGYGSYKLDHSQAAHLLKALHLKKQLRTKLVYFVESYVGSPTQDVGLPEKPGLIGLIQSTAPTRNIGQPLMLALGALLASGALFRGGAGQTASAGSQPTTDTSDPGGVLGGLGGLLNKLEQGGLGNVANSWVRSGQNQPVSPGQLGSALGPSIIRMLAQKSGLSEEELTKELAQHLPGVVSNLTPDGRLPTLEELSRAWRWRLSSPVPGGGKRQGALILLEKSNGRT